MQGDRLQILRSACRDAAGDELAPAQRRADARLLPDAPAPPPSPIDPFEALVKRLEDGAIVVDPYTATPTWDGSPWELGPVVEWFLDVTTRAEEFGKEVVP